MLARNIIVIGASAGGVEALIQVVKGLPVDLPAAIFMVLHITPYGKSVLPSVLSRAGWMPAVHPRDYETIQMGRIYVAPPDYHLLVKPGYVRLTRGAKENGHRPAVDPLFRTAAAAYGHHVVGVVLSGTRDDGSLGMLEIKNAGGITIVQDPSDAAYPGMPRSAMERVEVDHVLPLKDIATRLQQLVHDPVEGAKGSAPGNADEIPTDVAELEGEELVAMERSGLPSGFICPDCGGSLWEMEQKGLLHFRCRVGHAWSPDSLLEEQAVELEEALWTALRALEEHSALAQRVAKSARSRSNEPVATRFERQLVDLQRRAVVIRRLLQGGVTGETSHKHDMDDNENNADSNKNNADENANSANSNENNADEIDGAGNN